MLFSLIDKKEKKMIIQDVSKDGYCVAKTTGEYHEKQARVMIDYIINYAKRHKIITIQLADISYIVFKKKTMIFFIDRGKISLRSE